MKGIWPLAMTVLMALAGCGTRETTGDAVQTDDVGETSVEEHSANELCPEDLTDPSSFDPPFPYEPTQPVCLRWRERKRECSDALMEAMSRPRDPESPQRLLRSLHLAAQCQCYEERRDALKACVEAPDCAGFASCTIELTHDDWVPETGG